MEIIMKKVLRIKSGDTFMSKNDHNVKFTFLEDGNFFECAEDENLYKSEVKVKTEHDTGLVDTEYINLNQCEFYKNINQQYTMFRFTDGKKEVLCVTENLEEGMNILMTDMVKNIGAGDMDEGISLWNNYSDIYKGIKNGGMYSYADCVWCWSSTVKRRN